VPPRDAHLLSDSRAVVDDTKHMIPSQTPKKHILFGHISFHSLAFHLLDLSNALFIFSSYVFSVTDNKFLKERSKSGDVSAAAVIGIQCFLALG
jgi:hypothetical protein